MSAVRRVLARLGSRGSDERGAISAAMPIIAFALLVLAGLGIDGSRVLNARAQAVAYGEEGARSGALAIYPDEPRLRLDVAEVDRRVGEYCAAVEAKNPDVVDCGRDGPLLTDRNNKGQREPQPLIVQVRVRTEVKPMLLGMVYPGMLTASGDGRARPVEGLDERSQ